MVSNYVVVDSSFFLALYNIDDSQHVDAVHAAEELTHHTLVVHPYVVQEVSTVLSYRFGTEVAKKFLSDVKNANNVLIPFVDVRRDIDYFVTNAGKKMSFTDLILVALAENMNASLLTFDRQMLALFKKKT